MDSDFSAKLNFSSTDDDNDNSGRVSDAVNVSPSSGDVDETEDNVDVTVVSAAAATSATDLLDNDETDRRSDKASQTSFSSSDSVATLTDAHFSISQNEDPEHQDPVVVPTASSVSAPGSSVSAPASLHASPSASPAPSPSSVRSLNMERWLKGQGIDASNIVEGKRTRKPKKF